MSLVRLENVSKHYTLGEQQVQALKDVIFAFTMGSSLPSQAHRVAASPLCSI